MAEPRDRRGELRVRHRRSILGAARELLLEHGAGGVSADELAARADVARRTVFNHFASLDDVVVTCLEDELRAAVAEFEGLALRGAVTSPLEDLRASLAGEEVPGALARIARMSRGPGSAERQDHLQQRAMRHLTVSVASQLRARHSGLGDLDATLLTTTVLSGVSVVAVAWLEETGGSADPVARRRWAELLDHLFTTLRHGFAVPPPRSTEGA